MSVFGPLFCLLLGGVIILCYTFYSMGSNRYKKYYEANES